MQQLHSALRHAEDCRVRVGDNGITRDPLPVRLLQSHVCVGNEDAVKCQDDGLRGVKRGRLQFGAYRKTGTGRGGHCTEHDIAAVSHTRQERDVVQSPTGVPRCDAVKPPPAGVPGRDDGSVGIAPQVGEGEPGEQLSPGQPRQVAIAGRARRSDEHAHDAVVLGLHEPGRRVGAGQHLGHFAENTRRYARATTFGWSGETEQAGPGDRSKVRARDTPGVDVGSRGLEQIRREAPGSLDKRVLRHGVNLARRQRGGSFAHDVRPTRENGRMARRTAPSPPPTPPVEQIVDIDVAEEMRGSYLEYAYSVIYSRALPDARDGLKPVHRRILFQMAAMGLRPDRPHVKCARVVGDVMGKLHPHGDTAIYDALVRMAQPFSMRVPLVDGHGNFGSLGGDDPPAAYRYTECRLENAAELMTDGLNEEVVDFTPNYDGQEEEPSVLPAAFPNLLVNGAAGIAVGMATNMAPHNLVEVVNAARHLIKKPDASLDDLMRFVPGPDLPTGGKIIGLDGVREAYETGRGVFRIRATAKVTDVRARKRGIVVTELPYGVGPEKVIGKIKDLVQSRKLQGVADVRDLTDREHGLQLVIEVKNGFNAEAILDQLYKLTPMEDTFGVNNVALVDGQPLTLGLKELLEVYVDHRFEVVRRRSSYRRRRREDQLHLVLGRLIAILDIDEIIAVIRSSDDTAAARARLMEVFDLSEIQAVDILELPLRRLTKFSRLELEKERDQLTREITELTAILESDELLRTVVSDELGDVAKKFGTPRRTVLLESAGLPTTAVPLEVTDDPCVVLLSATGLLARAQLTETASPAETASPGEGASAADGRSRHDAIASRTTSTARGEIGVVTSLGRMIRLSVLELPSLPPTAGPPTLAGGAPVSEFVDLEKGEKVLGLATLSPDSVGLALGTASGVVKRVLPEYPSNKDAFELIALKDDDEVVGAAELSTGDEDLVFVTSDGQLLRFDAAAVRPQGRAAGGMAGVRLSAGARAVFFGAVNAFSDNVVVTIAGSSAALPGTDTGTVKVAPYSEYPPKGRATGGVRCHRFLRGEDILLVGWVGQRPPKATASSGVAIELPAATGKRDGSGTPLAAPVLAVGS
jgi:DNA gyrase subunit A